MAEIGRMKKTKKLVDGVPDEDLILQLMWEKACAPRHHYSPATWKPRPNDPGDEQLAGVYQKARAIIRECDRHVDALILQYVNNGGDCKDGGAGSREMAEAGAGTIGGSETATAAIDLPAIMINTKAASGPTTRLVPVPEASVLNLMWHKACAPRRDFPAWKPRPNDTRVELIQAYEKGTAIKQKWHQHDDDLISQYINNGCAYEEVQIGDNEEAS